MSRRTIADLRLLRRRVYQLLLSPDHAANDSIPLLTRLTAHGAVAIFGGVLRDLCMTPPSAFRSDIDLVVSTDSALALARELETLGGLRNRYGGFRVHGRHWTFDVWRLHDTWAFRHGLVKDPSFPRLVDTTFFNWDAIVLALEPDSIYYAGRYFEDLESQLLEINLEPNANPAGNVVRALRASLEQNARIGPKLAKYVCDFLSPEASRRPHLRPDYLDYLQLPHVRRRLVEMNEHIARAPTEPFCSEAVPKTYGSRYPGRT